jgi:hypothetical protein
MRFGIGLKYPLVQYILLLSIINNHKLKIKIFTLQRATARLRARTDYANRACNVTCNVMVVAKLVPRIADEPSAQRTASILRSLIDRTPFHRHRDECLCCKKSNSAHSICLSLIHTRRINNST